MTSTGFVVLPDTAAAAEARTAVPWASPEEHTHASGRPWLVGRWSPGEITVVTAGPVRVAVVGVCPVPAARLARYAARIRTVRNADELAAVLPGSCHLVVSAHGEVRFQGSVTGLRRVFRARLNDVDVASDRADVLAAMTGAGVDEQALALRVATGGFLPPPLGDRPLWSGVFAPAPGDCLLWEGDRAREMPWWRPPAPELTLAAGAASVRDALTSALDDRGPAKGRLSTDLSGGMDSTSLCFLAARSTPDLITFRWGEAEAGNDDSAFAAHAIGALDAAEHIVVPPDDLPPLFTDPSSLVDTEEPYPFARTLARTRHTARLLAGSGSRRHLAGHGGDELFTPFPGYLHGLLRRRPLTALRHVRGYGALHRWPVLPTLAALTRPGDEAAWWRAQAEGLTDPPPSKRRPALGWGLWTLRAPSWATATVVEAAREALRDTAARVQPHSPDLAQHQLLLALRTAAPWYRQLARVFADHGVQLDSPFFDDRVVEAVLAVRTHEHAGPWGYKPLLAEAMRGIVPEPVLGRSTKGEFSDEANSGLRRNLPEVLGMFEDSALAARGLIDPGILRTRLLAPQPDNSTRNAVEPLIGCETWLRATTRPTPAWRFDARAPAS
ncbi:lasso peptide isopeptide bond-forming cyclase [Streptomyces paradoxus]|uniref:Asparagine synthase (Glutamine-hydrolyzing) n=1 Tax=Streptomyces paradoxus TaxID=66375 RepID=A0A7W9WIH7_9ACTN|nr:lasso peptide isopeptide bond-forming cyclase [Streptomyces paradoxus]MBB6078333.1 asparagine synthase (glutamine-hydrolyzing) [Streptomyces paradoxus]